MLAQSPLGLAAGVLLAACPALVTASVSPSVAGSPVVPARTATSSDEVSAEELLAAVYESLGTKDRGYASLVKKVDKAVQAALKDQGLEGHAFLEWVDELTQKALARAGGRRASKETQALLETYPWGSQLQLPLGLAYGSDRPVPSNKKGFILLEDAPVPLPGYPELEVNTYLYGLDEIIDWQAGVKAKRDKVSYQEREAKDTVEPAEELPAWEALRVYLAGTLPGVPLFAIPELKRQVHTRLREHRGEGARLDELLALLDSKWNGYYFEGVVSRDPVFFVAPVHEMYLNASGFAFAFPASAQMAEVGDLPFLAVQSLMQFGEVFQGRAVESTDLIASTAAGQELQRQFDLEMAYCTRYKALVDLIVRSVASPESALPAYLKAYDFPEGRPPAKRSDPRYDVARSYAVLLWAAMGEDPRAVADWLHEEILAKEENAFPKSASLPVQFLVRGREVQRELLKQVAERIQQDPDGAYAQKWRPFVNADNPSSSLHVSALLHSYASYQARLHDAVGKAVRTTIQSEL